MKDSANFNIDTLATRYFLHPNRCDVFCEGEQDMGLIRSFLSAHLRQHVSVFPVSVVNIPEDVLSKHSLAYPSNRNEVIALALELEASGVKETQVVCVADADWGHLLGQDIDCSLLLFTDYTSMEMYAFRSDVLNRLLFAIAPKTTSSGQALLDGFLEPLQFLFAIRATNIDMKLGLKWVDDLERFCKKQTDAKFSFDTTQFHHRYVKIRLPASKQQEFDERMAGIKSAFRDDPRFQVRGHDFTALLTWVLRKIHGKQHIKQESLCEMLYMAIPLSDLAASELFSELLRRTSGAQLPSR